MPSAAHEAGYSAGKTAANKAKSVILLTRDTVQRGVVAGNAYKEFLQKVSQDQKWWLRYPQFAVGFWQGFMDRADQIILE